MIPTLEVIAGFATGAAIGSLDVLAATTGEQIDNNDSLTATIAIPRTLTVRQRTKLRFTGSDGRVREYRVRRIVKNSSTRTWDIEAAPVWMDLTTAGVVRTESGIATTFTVTASLSASDWLTTYVLSNLTADGLTWLDTTLGTIEATGVRSLSFQNATRMEVLQAVADAFQVEWQIAQPSAGALYRISLWQQRGGASGVSPVASARNLLSSLADTGDDQLATGVFPTGITPSGDTNPATLADNIWRIASIDSGWIGLVDPSGTDSPIGIDDLVNGLYLFGPLNGGGAPTSTAIADSSAATGAVFPVSTAGFAVGDLVSIRRTAEGAGVFELEHPTAKTLYDRTIAPRTVDGVRGEANRVTDGRFENGILDWAAVNAQSTPAFTQLQRSELGTTVGGRLAAARAAGTGTGTALQLKELPANAWVRQQDQIVVEGVTVEVTSDTLPDTSGVLALPISPGLPGTYPDNTPLTLVRKEQRTLTLDGAHSVLLSYFGFTNSNTNNLNEFRDLGQYVSAVSGAYSTNANGALFYRHPVNRAGAIALRVSHTTVSPGLAWATSGSDLRTFLAYSIVTGATTATFVCTAGVRPSVGDTIAYAGSTSDQFVITTTDGRTLNAQRWALTVSSVTDTGTGEEYTVVASPVVPSWATSVSGTYGQLPYPSLDEFGEFAVTQCNVTIATGTSWTVTLNRETRTVYTNGSHTTGATTLNLKAVTDFATRNWTGSDTIELPRDLSATLHVTAINSVTNNGGGTGGTYTVTVDLASSTMDSYALTDDWLVGEVNFTVVISSMSRNLRLDSLVGTTAVLRRTEGTLSTSDFTTPRTLNTSWRHYDTYALTGTANWASTGLVTLTLASAVPTGRSYAAGLPAWSPTWHTRASLGLNTELRINAAVSAGATTVQLAGNDALVGSSSRKAVVIIHGGTGRSNLPIPGDTLTAASSVQADGSGNANVTLVAANTNALSLNQNFSITRPAVLRSSDPTTGSVVRLLYAIGNNSIPLSTTPGIRTNYFRVEVPTGGTRLVTVYATIAMTTGTYALGQLPAIAILDGSGAILGYTRFANATTTVGTLVHGTLIAQATLSASANVALAVYGGFTNTPASWHVLLEAWGVQSAATDVPFVKGSHANALWLFAVKFLQLYARAVTKYTITVAQLQQITGLTVIPQAVVVGQTVLNEDTGDSVRVAGIVVDHFDYTKTQLILDTLRPTAARLLGVR